VIGRVARIKAAWLRVPLAYPCWLYAVGDLCVNAVRDGAWSRIFMPEFWSLAASAFWIVHDGVLVGYVEEKQ
jgi:hypothetical protein